MDSLTQPWGVNAISESQDNVSDSVSFLKLVNIVKCHCVIHKNNIELSDFGLLTEVLNQ